MKLVTSLSGVGLVALLLSAACGGDEPAEDPRAAAQLDVVPGCDSGMSVERDAGREQDAGAPPVADAGSDDDDDQDADADTDAGTDADAGASTPTDPACADLTYVSFGEAFLDKYCVGCHLGSRAVGGIDLSTLAGVRQHAEHVREHAVERAEQPFMPPASSRQPTDEEREKLGKWLGCGPK